MADINNLITDNIDIWTSAIKKRNSQGRGASKKIELTGVKKLRELILELAVRGKLVPQSANDEPASVLLERIAEEKVQLVADKVIKKFKTLPAITNDEKPFELQRGWEYVRLGYIGNIFNGNSVNAKLKEQKYTGLQKGLPFIATKDVDYGYKPLKYDNGVLIPVGEAKFKVAHKNAVLVCAEGGSAGKKCGITNQDICFGNKLFANELYAGLNPRFILFVYLSPVFFSQFSKSMTGIIGGISSSKFSELIVSLPPLAEQHRIVAKVDALMALCDQLEQQTEQSLSAHQTLVEVLLSSLLPSPSTAQTSAAFTNEADGSSDNAIFLQESIPEENFQTSWQRIVEHFDILFTTEQSIEQLKKTILQLAVMGKLIPQNPDDESASKLLEKIAAEKAQLIADKKIKKQKPLPAITEEDKPFEQPSGWSFSHMQDLCSLITDGTHQTPEYSESGRPFVSAQCVKPFRFMPDNCRYVSEVHYQNYIKNRKPDFGDVLLSRVGAGIGEAAKIDTDLEFAIYVSTGLLKPFQEFLLSEYLVLWLNSPVGRGYSERNTLGKGVSQGNLNLSLIRTFVVSIPPLAEQHRIVAKVGKLMALCEQLKARLSDAQTTQRHLAEFLVSTSLS
jgi:type I restriction enzyme S subunit